MRIWIDLGNSPHVPFFNALSEEFEQRGHSVLWTARDYAQTVEMAKKAGLSAEVFGRHGGKNVFQKGLKFSGRVIELISWARRKKFDLVVSHNSHEPLAVAKLLRIKSVNLMDYEHHPANHLSFRLAKRVVVPESFPSEFLRKFGVSEEKVRRYAGIKEDVYLADFEPDKNFQDELRELGITPENILIVVRPHAPEALYHRQFSNDLLDEMLENFSGKENVKIILLPRKENQSETLRLAHQSSNIIIPPQVLDGANLIASADWMISGGGTMNREAAALGVPVATIFVGKPAMVDEMLIREGRMTKIETREDLEEIHLVKKPETNARKFLQTRAKVADLILSDD